MKENFNTKMRITIGIKDLKLNSKGYFMDTTKQKEENVDYYFMRMQFARIFLLFCQPGFLISTITGLNDRADEPLSVSKVVLLINLVSAILL